MKIWIHLNGVQEGPFDFDTLPSDRITPQTPVWHSGLEYWVEAAKCPELAYLFAPKPEPVQPTAPEPEEITIEVTAPEPKPEVKAEDVLLEIAGKTSEAEPETKDDLDDLVGAAERMAEAVAARAQMAGADEELDIEDKDKELVIEDETVEESKPKPEEEEITDIEIEPAKTEAPETPAEAVQPEAREIEAQGGQAASVRNQESEAEQPQAQQPQTSAQEDASRPWEGGRRAQFPQGPQFDDSMQPAAQPYAPAEQPYAPNVAQAPQQPYGPYQAPQQPAYDDPACPKKPKSYIVWSILLILFCVNPLGIISLIYGFLVSKRYGNFDYAGAEQASEMAQWWLAITIVTGLISLPFMTILSL